MAYVVTQSCCSDASCVVACPVNCIHPAPGEPGFATAEMVFIDADSCVGCGACVTACPVGAIAPDARLREDQRPFVDLAAEYYAVFPHADRAPVAPVPAQRRLSRPGPFRVAVVGAIGQQWQPVEHERGRIRPGRYVVGWAKRGPTGFLGTNKADAQETVATLLDDLDAGASDYAGRHGGQDRWATGALGRSQPGPSPAHPGRRGLRARRVRAGR